MKITEKQPELIIIAGANGTGKSTHTQNYLNKGVKVIDPDVIAKELNPKNPRDADFQAGKLAVQKANEFVKNKTSFAIETTLSGKYHFNLIKKAEAQGFKTSLIFIGTKDPGINIKRIAGRVEKGGHHIDDDTVKRRYKRGMDNLGKTFDIVKNKLIKDNSSNVPKTLLIVDKKSHVSKYLPKWVVNALGKERIKIVAVNSVKQINRQKNNDREE